MEMRMVIEHIDYTTSTATNFHSVEASYLMNLQSYIKSQTTFQNSLKIVGGKIYNNNLKASMETTPMRMNKPQYMHKQICNSK